MADPQGPLDVIPLNNYPPILTIANYISIKQMINQILSEDNEYVNWKLKNLRTGGTMNNYINEYKEKINQMNENGMNIKLIKYNSDLQELKDRRIRKKCHKQRKRERRLAMEKQKLMKDNIPSNDKQDIPQIIEPYRYEKINKIPDGLIFPRDIYEKENDKSKYFNSISDNNMNGSSIANDNSSNIVNGVSNNNNGYIFQTEEDSSNEKLNEDEKYKLLINNLDNEQTNRFEVFHRTSLNKTQIKKLANTVTNQNITENIRVFLQAIGKMYIDDLIEISMEVRNKWLIGKMIIQFDYKKKIGNRLKKFLKKLTILVARSSTSLANTNNNGTLGKENEEENNDNKRIFESEDSVNEEESDSFFEDEKEDYIVVTKGNLLLKHKENNHLVREELIKYYNDLVVQFNKLDVSIEKYNNSPLLPEHIREGWRIYQLQSETFTKAQWRHQGERDGMMFR
ncbi:hypothetical protein TBLA_0D01530 [Henningerozyma blattae CBS 6284]|uniref:TAFII28-like protein domain-containing protein n=1 Tax=Henningerozyma blattae (strain ATCC 34711 / CBS 6284 / DSM 70876 / NBRC 10599 / NRRL Y-10934 / UCD 77-7) TaxID=1071380 RepID=I2H2Q9_HENB6|nr:hypothetical protein TBLA_0D01530 [Tetrapisispora blattae CBS 6284]CCH60661.1 hypothetical protein TBLA_0D01530 [Tetrapisispora blattae CBS 6284]